MKIKKFAVKYLPYQKGHNEDLDFLNDLDDIVSNIIVPEEYYEFEKFKNYIKNNPKMP